MLVSPTTETYRSSRQESPKSRKKVTTACESCKQRKVKVCTIPSFRLECPVNKFLECDGSQPCGRCTVKLLPCSYSANEDRRVRFAEKRRIKELEIVNQQLRDLIANIPQPTVTLYKVPVQDDESDDVDFETTVENDFDEVNHALTKGDPGYDMYVPSTALLMGLDGPKQPNR